MLREVSYRIRAQHEHRKLSRCQSKLDQGRILAGPRLREIVKITLRCHA
jgi:hypothetical protein